jgi:hypothetical protein
VSVRALHSPRLRATAHAAPERPRYPPRADITWITWIGARAASLGAVHIRPGADMTCARALHGPRSRVEIFAVGKYNLSPHARRFHN